MAAFRAIAVKSKSTDILVVYLAGHGVVAGGQDGDYYFLTQSALDAELKDAQARHEDALSGEELADLMIGVPAQKQVLVLDTCAAGRVAERLADRGEVPGSTIRSWEDMKDRTGMFILAGCASDAVSYEATRYGQGLLTFSLLEGMQGPGLKPGGFVDVLTLFDCAARRVEELARDIGGMQKPEMRSRRDARSFDIGKVREEDRAKIPAAYVRAVLVRPVFQEEARPLDSLGLGRKLEEALREVAARGGGSPVVFWDVPDAPNAYQLAGRYRVEGGTVKVRAFLYHSQSEAAAFTVEGDAADVGKLAEALLAEAERRVADGQTGQLQRRGNRE